MCVAEQFTVPFNQLVEAAYTLKENIANYRWPTVAATDAHNLVLNLASLTADSSAAALFQPAANTAHDLFAIDADFHLLKTDVQW